MNRDFRARFHAPAYSLFRIIVGLLFATHGAASLFGVFGGAVGTHGGTVPFGVWPFWWAAVIQLAGGLLVALGLLTGPAALISSGSMAYAYFVVHLPTALLPLQNEGEPSALYAWAFLLIAAMGPGAWSVSRLLKRDSAEESAEPQKRAAEKGAKDDKDEDEKALVDA